MQRSGNESTSFRAAGAKKKKKKKNTYSNFVTRSSDDTRRGRSKRSISKNSTRNESVKRFIGSIVSVSSCPPFRRPVDAFNATVCKHYSHQNGFPRLACQIRCGSRDRPLYGSRVMQFLCPLKNHLSRRLPTNEGFCLARVEGNVRVHNSCVLSIPSR